MNTWQVYKHRCLRVCGVLVWCGAIAMAQVDTVMIAGTVRDNSGAVIAEAAVTVTNLATNAKETTCTGSNGAYLAPLLKVGTYSLTVEKTGFQKRFPHLSFCNGEVEKVQHALQMGVLLSTDLSSLPVSELRRLRRASTTARA